MIGITRFPSNRTFPSEVPVSFHPCRCCPRTSEKRYISFTYGYCSLNKRDLKWAVWKIMPNAKIWYLSQNIRSNWNDKIIFMIEPSESSLLLQVETLSNWSRRLHHHMNTGVSRSHSFQSVSSQRSIQFLRMKIKDIEDDYLLHIIAKFIPCQIFGFVTWYWMKKKHPKVARVYIKHRKVQFRMKITTVTVIFIINNLSSINKTKGHNLKLLISQFIECF